MECLANFNPARCTTSQAVCIITSKPSASTPRTVKHPKTRNFMAIDDAQREIITRHADRLLNARDYPKTICPSEVARALSSAELSALNASEWRSTMDDIRAVVWEKREVGEVEVLQRGEVVTVERLEEIRGPMRVRLAKG
ncbi:hypothetical protein J1614_005517 [Plenodomus biglobosus]|nr:hypothetical protein J1614_005517 [Plenodomus biglobosus]